MAQTPPDLSQKPGNLHQRLTNPGDEEVDPLLEQTGCVASYTKLEACLGENDRDWTKCQKQVQALKDCSTRQQQVKSAAARPAK